MGSLQTFTFPERYLTPWPSNRNLNISGTSNQNTKQKESSQQMTGNCNSSDDFESNITPNVITINDTDILEEQDRPDTDIINNNDDTGNSSLKRTLLLMHDSERNELKNNQ